MGRSNDWMRRLLVALSFGLVLATASSAGASVPVPAGWPGHLALGVSDQPGDAQALARHAPFDARYQYLAGGVNTGSGWATWNTVRASHRGTSTSRSRRT